MVAKKSISRMFSVLLALMILLSSATFPSLAYAAGIRYAKPIATGAGDCSTWANACSLQTALIGATLGDEIWVTSGTYKPANGTDRNATFQLKNGVALYGGFVGTEMVRDQRDTALNLTILSGDIDNNDSQTPVITDLSTVIGNTTNSYHVVTGANNATLDGFTITAGNANGGGSAEFGGGMYNQSSSPTLKNVTFSGNSASSGGGMFNFGSPTLMNVTFSGNLAGDGGGMYNDGSSPTFMQATLTNVTFSGNSATNFGGGIYNNLGNMSLTNVTFSGNTAQVAGGGIGNLSGFISPLLTFGYVWISNTILWGNTAPSGAQMDPRGNGPWPDLSNNVVQDGCPTGSTCTSIITTDPMLGTLGDYGGFTQTIPLLPGSSAIDGGDDATCAATDQRGVPRPQGSHCDIGAYEFATSSLTITGNTDVLGVTLTYTDGTPQFVTTDGSGRYSISVPRGWSGTVTPYKIGYNFTPASKAYSNVQSDQTNQDYTTQVCATCADKDTTGVFRPTNGLLYLKNLNITGFADVAINYGLGGDYPVVGDWDGNGTATIGIYRNGSFYLRNSNTLGYADWVFAFGQPGDQPVAGDWNGDGVDTIGIYRPSTGQFLLRDHNSAGAADYSFYLGNVGDVGIAGDWIAKGFDTVGVFRPSNGIIFLKNTNQTGFADIALNYGLPGDQPVVGDWDGNGTDTIGVYRNARFLLRNSNTVGFADIVFGLGIPGDMPIAGDWDGVP